MPLSHRENYIRNARFQGPEWIPANVSISGASRVQLREDLEDVMARHPWMYPGFEKGKIDYDNFQFGNAYRAGEKFVDNWGCTWESSIDGIEGVVMGHPLSDWSALGTWQPPDPLKVGDRGPVDWDRIRADVAKAKAAGALTAGGVPHGFLFMRLTYLRGFENALLDMATGEVIPPEDKRLVYLKGARMGAALGRLEAEVVRILGHFGSTGAMRVEPAALQAADVLLDLYGEDIRARAFVTGDEGAEMMLRPDFTLPIVRLHMEAGAEPARYCYLGEIFRKQDHGETQPEHPRDNEYLQAGFELFARDADADAEVFALFAQTLAPLNLRAATGDIGILTAAVLIGVTTFAFSLAGVKIGNLFGARFRKKAVIAGGVILIAIGLKILIEHLFF